MREYHDTEWGAPSHDDRVLYEFMILESAQSGLSWRTILNKRVGYRALFAEFDPVAVAAFGPSDTERLVTDARIVRHRQKIESAIGNARRFVEIQESMGGFAPYLWAFTDGAVVKNRWTSIEQLPSQSELSVAVATDLRGRGFRFLGPTTVYSYLQAIGVIDDHLVTCPRW